MNSSLFSKSTVFTMNYALFPLKNMSCSKNDSFYDDLCSLFQKQKFLQLIMLSFSKTSVFTTNCAPHSFFQKHQFLQRIMLSLFKNISFYNEFLHFETFLAPPRLGSARLGSARLCSAIDPSRCQKGLKMVKVIVKTAVFEKESIIHCKNVCFWKREHGA